jgi:nucleoside-diphosphate-sugar epimerase
MTVIAVTGASGFIGRHFCRELADGPCRIVPILRPGSAPMRGASIVDFDEPLQASAALRGAHAVLHLAARAHVLDEENQPNVAAYRSANTELTTKVALAAVAAGVQRFVFVSSAGVLGRSSPPAGFDDTSAPHPHDAYTRSKLEAEQWLTEHCAGEIELVVVRPPLVYGPDARGNFGRILRAAALGRPLPVGSLRAPRSIVGVRNLSHFLMVCLMHPNAPGPPMLVAEPETATLADLAEEIARLAGVRSGSFRAPAGLLAAGLRLLGRGADAARLVSPFEIRVSRAQTALGWRPSFERSAEMAWTVRTFLQVSR